MTNEHIANAARKMTTTDLSRVVRALESELVADIVASVVGTQAHAGKLEMLDACGREIAGRLDVMLTGEAR